ncbi:galactoside-binding lectin domain-containing protein [Ditylenchus destructor]|nr:galactoside-binding lectin domain-containing protein [Ditylenchus destructor]
MHTIESPAIPFCYDIDGGLCPDAEIVVHGSVFNGERKSFEVNFVADCGDIALHFNPRFKHFSEHTIVLNTQDGGCWKREERHKNRMNIGDTFRLRIVNHHAHFLIEVNDHHVCHYEHRITPSRVTHLEIKGDVAVQRLHLYHMGKSHSADVYSPPNIPGLSPYPSINQPTYVQEQTYAPPPPAYSPYSNSAIPQHGMPTLPTIVKSCGCSTEHCHHGTHHDHHHDSHHHHHHHDDHHHGHHHHHC